MATIEEIKAKMAALKARTGKKAKDIWKPTDVHQIRCLPYPHGDEPIQELGFHYDIGNRSVLCPKYCFGEECVICDFAEGLRQWKDSNGNDKPEHVREADWELFKKIQVKERWYVPVIERGKEEAGAKFWAVGITLYDQLQGFCIDKKWNDEITGEGHDVLVDPECAFDLEVNFLQAKNKDKKGNEKPFGITEVDMAALRPSKLANSQDEIDKLVATVKPIHDVYPKVSSKEVSKIFDAFVNSGAPAAKVEDSGTEYKSNSAEKPVEGGKSIDEAFNELTG